jgi:2-C-methyl-D-erythritol 4-phosphate cytidylyltransferase / 2-C-methyl-D-erythritol 2,4-cyclodiphosphate synthase
MVQSFADAVIVAAGASRRMGGVDKLAAPLLGRPLVQWAVQAMLEASSVRQVVLVVAPDQLERSSRAGWLDARRTAVVGGGASRSDSVLAGVQATESEVVLVHDGARPLATPALADAVAHAAYRHGAAVPTVALVDAIKRERDGRLLEGIERTGLSRAQTPQAARRHLLLAAFAAAGGRAFADEAELLASHGVAAVSVPGEAANMKVTDAADLDMVRSLAAGRAGPQVRRGYGHDRHPFGPADGLWLGGVLIESAPRLYGHSDGDVALHALATAILAAGGLGDLGRMFPADDPSTEGAAGAELLARVVARAGAAGWRPLDAQVALVGGRPQLGAARLDQMRARIGELLGLPSDDIAVTASTGNLAGADGAGRQVSASAFVSLIRT